MKRLVVVAAVLAGCQTATTATTPTAEKLHVSVTAIDPAASLAITSEEVTFAAGANTVPGTLVRPTSGGPYAAVVLMAGSGPTDRDWNSPLLPTKNGSAKLLAEALAKHGLVVLRFDKAGVGANKSSIMGATTFDVYRDEGQAALAYLRTRPEVSPSALFVAGHSEGGIHATRVAGVEGDHIAGLVLLSAAGRSMRDIIISQLEAQLRVAMPQQADAELASIGHAFDDFLAGKVVDPMKVTAIPGLQQLVGAVVNPATATLARGLISFQTAPALAQLHVPVFVYNGQKDVQVDPEKDAKVLAAAAGTRATLFLAPDADHVLKHEDKTIAQLRGNLAQTQTDYNSPTRTLDDATVNALVSWLRVQTTHLAPH